MSEQENIPMTAPTDPLVDYIPLQFIWSLDFFDELGVSNEIRTNYLPPVLYAYAESVNWDVARLVAVGERLAMLTVQRIVADLPGLPVSMKKRCQKALALNEASAAAQGATLKTKSLGVRESAWAAGAAAQAAIQASEWVSTSPERARADAELTWWAVAWAVKWAAQAAETTEKRGSVFLIAARLWAQAANPSWCLEDHKIEEEAITL